MRSSEVKFNGVYQSGWRADIEQEYVDPDIDEDDENSGSHLFFRFYADGIVIIACIAISRFEEFSATQIISWFKKDNESIGIGRAIYNVNNDVIYFTDQNESIRTEYNGVIRGDLLDMTIVNHIGKITSQLQFNFIELDID